MVSRHPVHLKTSELLRLFPGDSEMARRIREFDWSSTPLGTPSAWPHSLQTVVQLMLDSRYAMWMAWGRDLTFLCNDAYLPTLGRKQDCLGASARQVWAEIWPEIGPRIERVLSTGTATWDEGLLLYLERLGFPEETFHSFSYSPIRDDAGVVGGMLCVVTEDTERIIGERRLTALSSLSSKVLPARSLDQACMLASDALAQATRDLPFTLIYLLDGGGASLRLTSKSGDISGAPDSQPLGGAEALWPFLRVMENGQPMLLEDLPQGVSARIEDWPEPVSRALLLPLGRSGHNERPLGVMVAGISPRRPFDAAYRDFVVLLAQRVENAISDARAYEQEHRRAEALAELDRAKTLFFSNISHEFRTPLTLLMGPAEGLLAMRYGVLSRDVQDQVDIMQRNALRLQKLVNTLLDFSRIEAGRLQAHFEPTRLDLLTADLASTFRSAVEEAGMQLIIDCPPLPEPVMADPDMWEKIVINLISNAFKYTLKGEIYVSLKVESGHALLTVCDTGIGIAEQDLPHLFDRFYRVRNAQGRSSEGTGIGLALVHELAKLHGGEIKAASRFGEGSTFTVRIPVVDTQRPAQHAANHGRPHSGTPDVRAYLVEAQQWLRDSPPRHQNTITLPQPSPYQAPALAPATGGGKPRILVADDNADMREYLLRLLKSEYEVTLVADGRQALQTALKTRPELVLTDVMMPGLDGFDLLRALRLNPATAGTAVILLSARAGEEARIEGLEAGADDYLVKPFSARELLARINSVITRLRVCRQPPN